MTLQSINHNRNYYEKGRNLEKFNSFGLFYYLYKVFQVVPLTVVIGFKMNWWLIKRYIKIFSFL